MPGYIKKLLLKYKHNMPNQPQYFPYSLSPKQYGAKAQAPLPINISPKLSPEEIKEIQRIVSSTLYYNRAVEITVLMALSSIAIEQTKGTTNTMGKAKQLLDYLTTNPDVTIWYRASNMIMNVHLDASYLSESDACSHACGHFFHGLSAKNSNPIKMNGAFFTLCVILWFVVTSTAEAELGVLFLSFKEGMISAWHWKNWDTPSQKYRSIATMQPLSVSWTTLLRDGTCNLWKWDISGCVIKLHKMHMMLNGTLGRKIWLIIKASITPGRITRPLPRVLTHKIVTLGITQGDQT